MTITSKTALQAARRHMSGPFAWARADCFSASDDTFADLWGIAPLASLRAAYGDLRSGIRLMNAHGGYVPGVVALCQRAGLRRTDVARPGDLCLIDGPRPFGAVLGIAIDDVWTATKGKTGLRMFADGHLEVLTCRS